MADAPSAPSVRPGETAEEDAYAMTNAEHRVVALLAEAWNVYAQEVVGDGPTRSHDLGEFVSRLHDLQHAVLAQAAARAYPDRYRLAGGTVESAPPGLVVRCADIEGPVPVPHSSLLAQASEETEGRRRRLQGVVLPPGVRTARESQA